MSQDKYDEPICEHRRVGIVTNQPGSYDRDRAHASTAVCGSIECRVDAMAWVYRQTGEHGVYLSDAKRKASA